MYKQHLKAAGMNAFDIQSETGIPLERAKRIYSGSMDPWRGEVQLVDKICGANGRLVMQFCAERCPEGKYLGLEYPDISPELAVCRMVTVFTDTERMLVDIASLICQGIVHGDNPQRRQKLAGEIRQLKQCLTVIEIVLRDRETCASVESTGLRAYLKEKTAQLRAVNE